MTVQKVDFNPHFGAFIIETLTLGMYGESRNALREYIQNSFDALQEAIADGLVDSEHARVDVRLDPDRRGMTIRDNGVGLRTENATSVLGSIGASNKDYRRNAGFRGIGRLAGIVFCNRLVFSTKSAGQTQKTVVVFKAQELRDRLNPEAGNQADAAQTLRECVEATLGVWGASERKTYVRDVLLDLPVFELNLGARFGLWQFERGETPSLIAGADPGRFMQHDKVAKVVADL
jgi:hypothetical protein